jgi:riboflavin biosynthesis pyrimidine reductase
MTLGFGFEDLSGRVGIAEGGFVVEAEDRSQVQRIRAAVEGVLVRIATPRTKKMI